MRLAPASSTCTDYERSKGNSPDRLDALVWALTELMVEGVPGWGLFEFYKRDYERRLANPHGWDIKNKAEGELIKLRAPSPAPSSLITIVGRSVLVPADGIVEVSAEEAKSLLGNGWTRVEQEPVAA